MGELQFLGTAKPGRENWLQNMTDEEKAIMAEHLAYVDDLFKQGGVLFSGACTDGVLGMVVYQAESQEEALEMFESDPLVKSGIVDTEFHPFRSGHIKAL